jgi:hypothetical protein
MSLKDSDKPKKKKISKQVFISADRNYKRKYVGYDDDSQKVKQVKTLKGIFKGVPKVKLRSPSNPFDYFPEFDKNFRLPSEEITKLKKGGTKDKKWIQKAVNPKHKGYCTPMSKPTCTPKRKALAMTFKKMAKKK